MPRVALVMVPENCEIGAGTEPVDRVFGLRVAAIEVRRGHGRQVTARGEPHDPDALWITAPLLCAGTRHPDGALGVEKGDERVALRHPVFQHNPHDAVPVEPSCNTMPFGLDRQPTVSAAGTDHNCRPVRFGRTIDRDRCVGRHKLAVADRSLPCPERYLIGFWLRVCSRQGGREQYVPRQCHQGGHCHIAHAPTSPAGQYFVHVRLPRTDHLSFAIVRAMIWFCWSSLRSPKRAE